MKKSFQYKFYLLLSLTVAIFAGRYLLTSSHFHTHDDIQVFRIHEFIQCFKDSQIPCRWSKNLGKGFGYPLFIFYPPVIYVFPALISTLGFSLITSLNLFALLTMLLAAYSMFKLAYRLTDKNPRLAFLASVMYTFYPYHAVNLFVRGVYAETFAWSIFPLVLEGFYRLAKGEVKSIKPAIALTLILLSHNISTMLMYPLTIIWTFVIYLQFVHFDVSINRLMKVKIIKQIVLNLILPLGLSAFYFLPMILEKPLVQTESMIFGYYSFVNHFVSLKQLFLSNFWGYGGSTFGTKDDGMSFMIGKPYWILFLILNLVYVFQLIKHRRLPNLIEAFSLLTSYLLLFLTHAKSTPIWLVLKPLQYAQFPWRFIGLTGTMMIIFSIYALNHFTNLAKSRLFIFLFAGLLIFRFLPFFKPEKFNHFTDQDFISGSLKTQQQQEHVFDYLPKTVHSLPDEFASSPIFRVSETPQYKLDQWNSNNLVLEIDNPQPQTITFSVFFYPGWTAALDNQPLVIKPHPNYGLIQAKIPAGKHQVSFRFHETSTRLIADFISLISLATLFLVSRKIRFITYFWRNF